MVQIFDLINIIVLYCIIIFSQYCKVKFIPDSIPEALFWKKAFNKKCITNFFLKTKAIICRIFMEVKRYDNLSLIDKVMTFIRIKEDNKKG